MASNNDHASATRAALDNTLCVESLAFPESMSFNHVLADSRVDRDELKLGQISLQFANQLNANFQSPMRCRDVDLKNLGLWMPEIKQQMPGILAMSVNFDNCNKEIAL